MVERVPLVLPTIGRCAGCKQSNLAPGAASVRCMDMTEGERKVDGKRQKREPRAMPEIFPKPSHQVVIAGYK